MASFDIVSRLDHQEVDNAVNNTRKTLSVRYDFRNSPFEIDLNKKENKLTVLAEDKMKLKAIQDDLTANFVRRGVDPKVIQWEEPESAAKGHLRCTAKLVEGIDQDTAKKMVKMIKDMKLKVQAQIQGDQLRVQGKKIDELQEVIQALKAREDLPVPLQYVNMKN